MLLFWKHTSASFRYDSILSFWLDVWNFRRKKLLWEKAAHRWRHNQRGEEREARTTWSRDTHTLTLTHSHTISHTLSHTGRSLPSDTHTHLNQAHRHLNQTHTLSLCSEELMRSDHRFTRGGTFYARSFLEMRGFTHEENGALWLHFSVILKRELVIWSAGVLTGKGTHRALWHASDYF